MKKRSWLVLLAVIAIMLAVSMALSSCQKELTPLQYLEQSAKNTLYGATDSTLMKLLPAAANSGSIEILYNATKDMEDFGLPFDKADLKMYFSKGTDMALNMNVSASDTDMNMEMYRKGSKFAVKSSILNDMVYGLDTSDAKNSYLSSIFADPNSDYSLTAFFGEKGEYFDNSEQNAKISESVNKLLSSYEEKLRIAIENNATVTMEKQNGGKLVTVELNNESLGAVIRELYNEAKKDTALREELVNILKLLQDLPDFDLSTDDILKEYDEFFKNEGQLNDIISNINEVDFSIRLKAQTNSKNRITSAELVMEEYIETGKTDKIALGFEMTEDGGKEKAEISFEIKTSDPEGPNGSFKIICEETTKTNDKYSAKMSVYFGGMTIDLLELKFDKKSGEFELTSPIASQFGSGMGGNPVSVKGTYKEEKNSVTITITDISASDVSVKLDLTVIIKSKDSMPSFPKYTDIFTLTESQMEEIIENIRNSPLGAFGDSPFDDYDDQYEDLLDEMFE